MKVYFNTKTFDELTKKSNLIVTNISEYADLLVLGAKKVNYHEFVRLKAVYRFGIGFDNIDIKFLKKRSIPVYFPGAGAKRVLYDATANFTVYGILSVLYKEAFGDANSWRKTQRDYIGNKKALIVGVGNIGQRVQKKLKVFMKVSTYDILTHKPEELEKLMREADVITVHIPLNNGTKQFFDGQKLSWVKNNVLIANTARGELFDENALYEKLRSTNCKAFFDVFWQEPYQGKLKKLGSDKFFMTPHSASNTKEFISAGFKDILNIMEKLKK